MDAAVEWRTVLAGMKARLGMQMGRPRLPAVPAARLAPSRVPHRLCPTAATPLWRCPSGQRMTRMPDSCQRWGRGRAAMAGGCMCSSANQQQAWLTCCALMRLHSAPMRPSGCSCTRHASVCLQGTRCPPKHGRRPLPLSALDSNMCAANTGAAGIGAPACSRQLLRRAVPRDRFPQQLLARWPGRPARAARQPPRST